MRFSRSAAALAAFALLPFGKLDAQTSSRGRAYLGAVTGSVAGALVGGVLGGYIGGNRCTIEGNPDSCYLILGTATGLAIGMTAGAPIGAHLFNHRRGNVAASLVASTLIGAAGFAAFRAIDKNAAGPGRTARFNAILVATPVLQIFSSGYIEHRTGRAR